MSASEPPNINLRAPVPFPILPAMKPIAAALLVLASAVAAMAQVNVEVRFDQDQFLPNEKLVAKVRVSNFSGQKLQFGDTDDWLVLNVESREGKIVEKLAEVPVKGAFELDSSSAGTKRIDLAPYFNLTQPGRYLVTATIKVKQWNREWSSKGSGFNIIKGTKLWEQDFGVPRAGSGEPELRKYSLLQAIYLKQITLYARVSDVNENRVFKVYPIGPMVSFSKPESQVDKYNNLHVIWQVGARSFQYVMLNADGTTVLRQTYDYGESRPTLRPDEEGRVAVGGGVRRETKFDLPEPAPAKEDEPKPLAQP